jgi:large subunit ribosomal protein L4
MTQITIYNAQGAETGKLELDPTLLDKAVRRPLLKEALIAHLASQRQGTHKTKKRDEVAGGGKKPWKQKGTGRARAGSTRSPVWVGGGHAKTVEPRDYAYQLPAGQRRIALLSGLRYRLEKGGIKAVEGLDAAKKPDTKSVAAFLKKVGLAGKGTLLVFTKSALDALVKELQAAKKESA